MPTAPRAAESTIQLQVERLLGCSVAATRVHRNEASLQSGSLICNMKVGFRLSALKGFSPGTAPPPGSCACGAAGLQQQRL